MKVWVDGVNKAPRGYVWCRSTDRAKETVNFYKNNIFETEIFIDVGTDTGDFHNFGGDFINFLQWLSDNGFVDETFTFKTHGTDKDKLWEIKKLIRKNKWTCIDKFR